MSCCFSVGERWSERISGPRGGLRLPRRIVMVVLERHSAASRLRRVEVAAAIVMVDNVFKRDEDAVVHVGHVGAVRSTSRRVEYLTRNGCGCFKG